MKTTMGKKQTVARKWHLYDLKGKVLGRAATEIAQMLIGKNKPLYSPHVDSGDYVVAINADKIKVTGKKMTDKIYYRHSGYPGGFRQETLEQVMAKNPAKVIESAVQGMLPKNKLQTPRLRRLKVVTGEEHGYTHLIEGSEDAK